MNEIETNNLRLLCMAVVALETPEEAWSFLLELCTHQEIKVISQRLAIAELLLQKIPYAQINIMLDSPSTATISRINDTVKNGNGSLGRIVTRVNGAEGN